MRDARPDRVIEHDDAGQRRTGFGILQNTLFQLRETGLVVVRQKFTDLIGLGVEFLDQQIDIVLQLGSAEVLVKFESPIHAAGLLGGKIAVQRHWNSENRRHRHEIRQYRAQNLGTAFAISVCHNKTGGFWLCRDRPGSPWGRYWTAISCWV